MTRLILLLIAVALVVPGAAVATPAPDRDTGTRAALNANGVDVAAQDAKWRDVEKYYASYDEPAPAEPAPASVATDGDGLSLPAGIGIGFGLVVLAGGIGVYAGRSMRPRGLGA